MALTNLKLGENVVFRPKDPSNREYDGKVCVVTAITHNYVSIRAEDGSFSGSVWPDEINQFLKLK